MGKPRSDFYDRLQYGALRVVHLFLNCWPIEWSLAMARGAGTLMYIFDRRHRKRAIHNIHRCFPEKSDREVRALAHESCQQLFLLFAEVLLTTRHVRLETIGRHIEIAKLQETLRLLLKPGQGLIMLTGHYGNWEILGYAAATLGFETVSIARPLDNRYVNRWLLGVRERMGQRIIAKKGAMDEVVDALNQHIPVGIVADQNAGPKGMFVEFFGRLASTHKSIGLLAMRHRVPVVIGYARRLDDRLRFELGIQEVIYPADWDAEADPLRYITQRYTRAIEDFVSQAPGQYLWVHRRWKTRPKGEEPEPYD